MSKRLRGEVLEYMIDQMRKHPRWMTEEVIADAARQFPYATIPSKGYVSKMRHDAGLGRWKQKKAKPVSTTDGRALRHVPDDMLLAELGLRLQRGTAVFQKPSTIDCRETATHGGTLSVFAPIEDDMFGGRSY